ncbi:MAG: hypothetical protein HN995_10315 [Candidatus Marinimicrobia bacterium]|jgi:hypothetical protein|nr:hypothetical protein [Candidatus Neomarinimicrobiota bacterium]MBT3577090.1 hypothetical protein [Candidatus Neomarinimicrobiota bacterium]MBT3679972.1 hypothetical protein [Candidatus Neomarinimicrobiota bacterium]MBT3949633.1 hypothetical protein [Candidatus Neomarinimicrobiota bacterium]MBT4253216.1 hypothetical protein [Candidatus Neomarinimicrobiota bacterium]
MNLDKLEQAEAKFFNMYPGGFEHPDMVAIGKKHKMDKMITTVQEEFSEDQFGNSKAIVQAMSKLVSRSSMVSLFEKPKFRDFVNSLHNQHETILANGLREMLHGNQEQGFNMMLDVLISGKMAKWSLISVLPVYHKPYDEVFVKPTTAKGVIQQFELGTLVYKPRPSWEFYKEFRSIINEMKTKVDSRLAPNNAAFTGFLMMSLDQ